MESSILVALALGAAAAAQPGPFQAYVVTQALRAGPWRTLPASLAPLLSDGPIVALVLVAIARLPAAALRGLSVAGGAFALFLAWGALRGSLRREDEDSPRDAGGARTLWSAVLVNLLNPGPYLFWTLVAGPRLLGAWRDSAAGAIAFLAGFYGGLVGTLAALILAFGLAGSAAGPRVRRGLLMASALALAALGAWQIGRGMGIGGAVDGR